MKFLQNLMSMAETTDMSELPTDVMDDIQKNIRDGAKDKQQHWANALELTHKAYEVSGVQRPTPDMTQAWKQYEINLQYSVEQLAKYRGMGGDWRMSSAIFNEALERRYKFRVIEMGNNYNKSHTIETKNIDDIINAIKQKNSVYDVKVDHSKDPENPHSAMITFSKWGVRKNYKVKIQLV